MRPQRLLIAAVAVGLVCSAAARADTVSSSPTLPPLGVPFGIDGMGSCFPAAGACATPGTLTLTSLVSSPPAPPEFNQEGQDILANATLTGVVTTAPNTVVPLLLTGTIEMEVLERTSSEETGSWSVEIRALELAGPALGHTLMIELGSSAPGTGTASVEPVSGKDGQFLIGSFFDVFVGLTLDTPTPLHATRDAHLELGAPAVVTPEPASAIILGSAVLVLGAAGRRAGRRAEGLGAVRL